jgi:hypothetical protein
MKDEGGAVSARKLRLGAGASVERGAWSVKAWSGTRLRARLRRGEAMTKHNREEVKWGGFVIFEF